MDEKTAMAPVEKSGNGCHQTDMVPEPMGHTEQEKLPSAPQGSRVPHNQQEFQAIAQRVKK